MTGQDTLDVTRTLGDFAAGLTLSDIPQDVADRAKTLILDTMGIAVRAQHEAPSTPALIAAARALGYANGSSRVIGSADGWTPPGAAWLNGALAHSLDFDDTHAGGSIHPSAPIVPAAFAAAEMSGCDGATVLAAIIAGYEVQIRLSLALNPIDHYNRGYHPTATCGVFGAAAAPGAAWACRARRSPAPSASRSASPPAVSNSSPRAPGASCSRSAGRPRAAWSPPVSPPRTSRRRSAASTARVASSPSTPRTPPRPRRQPASAACGRP